MFKRAVQRALSQPKLVKEQTIINFADQHLGLSSLQVRSDEVLGGFSTADLTVVDNSTSVPQAAPPAAAAAGAQVVPRPKSTAPAPTDPKVYGVFQGDLSLDLPEDNPDVVKLGFAMFRTKDREPKWLGLGSEDFLDLSNFTQIGLRVRGDRRKYFVNIQGDTPYPTDVYQHRLFLKNVGEWETVTIPFSNFILTNGGVIQRQEPLNTANIRSVGIGLIDGQYGPYRLDIDWIKAIAGSHEPVEPPTLEETLLEGDVKIKEEPTGPYAPGKNLPMD